MPYDSPAPWSADENGPERDDGRRMQAAEAYLERIGISPETAQTEDLETLARIQRAHVTSVPFENLDIVGDPYDSRTGPGVVLDLPHIFGKIVERGRGGFCYELNGLFHVLLDELGYDVDRIAARITTDGEPGPPANHHTNIVELDRRYVVDVGMGIPALRQPIPLEGGSRTDEADIKWRVAESDRPDETYRLEFHRLGAEKWSRRFVFSDVSRRLRYFEATCDYLQTAPESKFTGDLIVTIATEEGHRKLSRTTLTEIVGSDTHRHTVTGEDWHAVLESEFDLRIGRE